MGQLSGALYERLGKSSATLDNLDIPVRLEVAYFYANQRHGWSNSIAVNYYVTDDRIYY